jgi:hypothetical protein
MFPSQASERPDSCVEQMLASAGGGGGGAITGLRPAQLLGIFLPLDPRFAGSNPAEDDGF